MSLNRVTIIGYLGQDPELRLLAASGQPVANFSVATDEVFTDKEGNRHERVDWHHIVVYGRAAETCKEYLCVQQRLARSAGDSPVKVKARAL